MKMIDIVKKAFIGGDWFVGYRKKEEEAYNILSLDRQGWIADPFLFEYEGDHFLFVEYVAKDKGEIAYFKFIDGKPVFQKVVISEPYHLSYPCVFSYNDEIYLIPESADNHTIDLYKANEFPDTWEKIKTLEKGLYFDTTYVPFQGKEYLVSYTPAKGRFLLQTFSLNLQKHETKLIGEIEYAVNKGRPAGSFFTNNGNLFRPAQDCARKYGENLLYYQIIGFGTEEFTEEVEELVSASQIDAAFQRIHTYNQDSEYEVVDLLKERFSPLRPIKLAIKIIKQRIL